MLTKKIKQVNLLNIAKIFFFLFILSLFFPIRYVFPTESSYLTGIYSDFTSISLYLSDILLFITFLFIVSRGNDFWRNLKSLKFWILWLILATIWQIATGFSILNAFFFLKLLELIVLYGTIVTLFKENQLKKPFLTTFAGLAGIQSIIALLQFIYQGPIGLKIIGEQVILPQILGVAKIIVSGETLIRGYGTFPHPNPLSAFLIVGIFSSIWLLMNSSKRWQTVVYSFLLTLNVFGLTVTFSRAAFLALFIGLLIFFGISMFNGKHISDLKKIIIITILSIISAIVIFQPYLLTRATISDNASLERMFYNKIGIKMVQDNPIFGVGAGESVLHMEQYSKIKLWPWQKQPIHNFFLLSAAELGVIGMLILLSIFIVHLKKLVSSMKYQVSSLKTLNTYYLLLITIFICFLILMLFDHYFYTLEQTQMLLWLVLGLMAAEIKNFSPSLERSRGEVKKS